MGSLVPQMLIIARIGIVILAGVISPVSPRAMRNISIIVIIAVVGRNAASRMIMAYMAINRASPLFPFRSIIRFWILVSRLVFPKAALMANIGASKMRF